MRTRSAVLWAALGASGIAFSARGDDWPSRLGPTFDGRSAATRVFAGRPAVTLKKEWGQRFEGGRAGVTVANGRVITLVGQAEHDFAIAWDAATGRELWKADLGATHPGQYGGPASTPALDGSRAFVLASSCQLRAFDAATGRALWTVDLKERYQAAPRQGCLSSPIVHDGRVVVQTGAAAAEQPRVIALDPATGEPAWQAKLADRAPYTSPLAATLGGVTQLLVHHFAGTESPHGGITSLEPRTGSVLWSQTPAASKGVSFEAPFALGSDRVALITFNDFSVQQVKKDGAAWRMDELWRSPDLSASVSPPVLHEGHLYGFGGDDLVCVEAATGKVAWKKRLYGGSVILVDGHLVVLSQASGEVRVVEATPAAYREKAMLPVLARGARSDAPPSFAGGRIFVRSDEELAAVAIGN
jgi:outer membrane protein assembly factor BamB